MVEVHLQPVPDRGRELAFGLQLSEYHTGYRAYRREVLETVNFELNSDKFIFDQEIMAQIVEAGFRIAEVPVPTRYFAEASSASFLASTRYGARHPVAGRALRGCTARAAGRSASSRACATATGHCPDARRRLPVTATIREPGAATRGLVEGYQTSRRYQISTAVYEHFLAAFADANALHVDDATARAHGFPAKVTHGMILGGFISHFVGMHFPGERTLLQSVSTQFKSPSHVGDEIEIAATVTQVVESVNVVTMDLVLTNLTRGARCGAGEGPGGPALMRVAVTGGSGGIGAATVRAPGRAGARGGVHLLSQPGAGQRAVRRHRRPRAALRPGRRRIGRGARGRAAARSRSMRW